MLVVFAVGIEQIEVYAGCVLVSVLIHYFTLVAVMWMGAEALLMFQKLVIVFVQISKCFMVTVSLVCWCKLTLTCISKLHASFDTSLYSHVVKRTCFFAISIYIQEGK